jgi:hypothetical protein
MAQFMVVLEVSAGRGRRIGVAGLMQRLLARACADDPAEVIRHRLNVFAETTSPLIDYYRDRDILTEVDGDQPLGPSPPTSRPGRLPAGITQPDARTDASRDRARRSPARHRA